MPQPTRQYLRMIVLALASAALPAAAADDPAAAAMKLYNKNQYESAARGLRAALPALDASERGAAWLTLGMIYLRNAELHRELYRTGVAIELDYLRKLAAVAGSARSRYVDFYLGEAFLQAGDAAQAQRYLEQFRTQPDVADRHKTLAAIGLGLAHSLLKDSARADEFWAAIDSSDPETRAALAAAYATAGRRDKDPPALAEAALADQKKTARNPQPRMTRDLLHVYARSGQTDKGLDLARRADLKAAAHAEVLGKAKTINFYDLSLFADLATLYTQAAVSALEKAGADARLKGTADYYLAEAYVATGQLERALKADDAFLALAQTPPAYRERARARQAATRYQLKPQPDTLSVWEEFAQKQPVDPDILADVVLHCLRVKAECTKIVTRAGVFAEAGEGKKFFSLNRALGRYYLSKRDYSRAVLHLEAGRDKSRKNKIEANDPAMLVNLAEGYYRVKKFSENLEIYFEMSKEFPVVRQIQNAMQGIYLMEHKSAGDVKSF